MPATESRGLDDVLASLPVAEAGTGRVIRRLQRFISFPPGSRVLDIGAAQGSTIASFNKAGYVACGVEPWEPAIEIGRQLAERTGVPIEIRHGVGERLPYEDESFDYVHAYSVVEHVDDPDAVFREAYRVLRPGGAFYFSTSGVINPRQGEIRGFPLFPWYPPRLQRAIMNWAVRARPALVGNTTRPALHWFKHRTVRRTLVDIGFTRLVNIWEMRSAAGEFTGVRGVVVDAAARHSVARLAVELVAGGVQYLVIK